MGDVRDAIRYLRRFAAELLEAKQAEPGDDITTALVAGIEQGLLTHADARSLLTELLSASVDNTTHSMGLMIWLLCEHPDQWALVAADDELVERAVEESRALRAGDPAGHAFQRTRGRAARHRGARGHADDRVPRRRPPRSRRVRGPRFLRRDPTPSATAADLRHRAPLLHRRRPRPHADPRGVARGHHAVDAAAAGVGREHEDRGRQLCRSHPSLSSFSHWRAHDHHRARPALGPRRRSIPRSTTARSPPRSRASTPTSIGSARSTTSSTSARSTPRAHQRRRRRARGGPRPRPTRARGAPPGQRVPARSRHHRQPRRARRCARRRAADAQRRARAAGEAARRVARGARRRGVRRAQRHRRRARVRAARRPPRAPSSR